VKENLLIYTVARHPSEAESATWARVEPVLQYTPQILYQLQIYRGAVCEIKNVSMCISTDYKIKVFFCAYGLYITCCTRASSVVRFTCLTFAQGRKIDPEDLQALNLEYSK
jgi:hypothetical protein